MIKFSYEIPPEIDRATFSELVAREVASMGSLMRARIEGDQVRLGIPQEGADASELLFKGELVSGSRGLVLEGRIGPRLVSMWDLLIALGLFLALWGYFGFEGLSLDTIDLVTLGVGQCVSLFFFGKALYEMRQMRGALRNFLDAALALGARRKARGRSLASGWLAGALFLGAAGAGSAEAAELIYVRDEPAEARRVVAELYERGALRLDVPYTADCEDEDGMCVNSEDYARLALVRFSSESNSGDEGELGFLAIAANPDDRAWNEVLALAKERLSELGTEALGAGVGFAGQYSPLSLNDLTPLMEGARVLSVQAGPSLDTGLMYSLWLARSDEGEVLGTSYMSMRLDPEDRRDDDERFLESVLDAVASVPPTRFASPWLADTRKSVSVWLERSGSLPPRASVEALAARPAGLDEQRVPLERVGSSVSINDDEELMEAVMEDGKERWTTRTPPLDMPLDLLDERGLFLSFTIERREQPLGFRPAEASIERERVVLGLIPLPLPPFVEERGELGARASMSSEEVRLDPDLEAFVDEVGAALVAAPEISAETIDRALYQARMKLGPRSSWIVPICPPDAEDARFIVHPTGAYAPITNGDSFCRELDARMAGAR